MTSRLQVTVWSSVAGGAVLAVLAAGGLDPEDNTSAQVEPLVIGGTVDLGPFDVAIERMRVLDELPGVSEDDDATRVLAIVATVSANGSRTQHGYLLTNSVALDGVTGVSAPFGQPPGDGDDAERGPEPAHEAFLIDDGTRLDALQPGLEYDVALVWEQDATAPAPTTARLVLVGHTLRESSIDRSDEWLDPLPMMAGDIEVTEAEPASGDGES